MEDLLYLCHRIPYPPNKGDKIRSFHILQYLSNYYRIHLGTFLDDEYDQRYLDELDRFTVDKIVIPIKPVVRKLASLRGLLTGDALSNEFYRHSGFADWVQQKITNANIRKVFLFSSPMAQFLENSPGKSILRVMDFVDVDSEKWLQYAIQHRFLMKLLYYREGNKLREYERKIASEFEASLFVSEQEAALFREKVAGENGRIYAMSNGVDTGFFDPAITLENPYANGQKVIVFTGAMDYWANVEAVVWFARQVFPSILNTSPEALFYIVGARPAEAVKVLAKNPGIRVTGSVKEIRPYIYHAHVAVAPLRVARGIQNKVLEAMAMKKYIVATPEAMEGIGNTSLANVRVAVEQNEFAQEVISGLANQSPQVIDRCRDFVLNNFSWDNHLTKLHELLEQSTCVNRDVEGQSLS